MQDDLKTRLCDAVDRAFDRQIVFLSALTSHPSTRGNEQSAQVFMADELAVRGYEIDNHQAP